MENAANHGLYLIRRMALLLLLIATPFLVTNTFNADAANEAPSVLRATLDNGLKVVIVRNTLAPVVATTVNYMVGANEAPEGFPGTAHAMEHMMFRGAPGLTSDQLADLGSVMGGNFNAATRQTTTQYYYTVPADDLDIALHIEALRMQDIMSTDADWNQERGAIKQEVSQDLSNPEYIMYTKLREAIFSGTPYAHDALGTLDSFDRTTAAMLKDFHATWYAPNNAILVVVGDVDPQATLAKIRELFGHLSPKKLPPRAEIKLGPVQPQSIKLDSNQPTGLQVIAMRMPGLDSPDYPALEVLVDVLRSSRGDLYELVTAGKALGTDFAFDPQPKAGLAYAMATFPAGGNPAALEAEIRAILTKIAREGVPAELVVAAKVQERRSAEFQKNSIAGLARVWSEAVAIDGLDSPDDDLARIERVTVADVNRVARQYLDLDHAITVVMTPQPAGKPGASQGFGGQEAIALGEAQPTALPDWAGAALNRLSVPASTVNPVVAKLPNGITLIVQPETVSSTVSVYGRIKVRPELLVPKGKEGLSSVLEDLFSYGTQKFDRIAFQEALDEIGAEESAGSDFGVEILANNFERGVELLAENELRPALPEAAFNIVKRQVSQVVAGQLTSPGYLSGRALRTALFPPDDASLRQALPQTVDGLTLQDVRDYYRRAFRPDLTTIVVIGNVTPQRARAVIEKYFGTWTAEGPTPETTLPPVPLNSPTTKAVFDPSRVQDRVTLAETLGLTRAHPDYYALELGNNVLGGAFYSTRLTREIRKNAGLVYYVQSYLDLGKTRGAYFVQYACDPQNVSRVHDLVVRELVAMQKTPVTADELQRAKALLVRRIPLGEASQGAIARGFLQRTILDLPLDEPTRAARRYLELNAADIQAAFAKWVRPDALVRVSQGPSSQ